MKIGLLLVTVFFLSCDNNENTDPLYGKWVIYKKVETRTDSDQVTVIEKIISPTNQECNYSCYMKIKKNSLMTYYINLEGSYTSEITNENPKEHLDYRIEKGALILSSILYPNNTTLLVETYYKKYDGELPPEN